MVNWCLTVFVQWLKDMHIVQFTGQYVLKSMLALFKMAAGLRVKQVNTHDTAHNPEAGSV